MEAVAISSSNTYTRDWKMIFDSPNAIDVSDINIGARARNAIIETIDNNRFEPLADPSRIPGSPNKWFRKKIVTSGKLCNLG